MNKVSKCFLSIVFCMLVLLPFTNVKALSVGGIDVPVVTSNDGLYSDTYESGRHVYKGTNPNNYIIFSGDMWRIISVESNGSLKLVKGGRLIGNTPWASAIDSWDISSLKTYLNDTYFPTLSDKDKVVSHNWGIGAVESSSNDLSAQIAAENSEVWNGKVGLIAVSDYLRANSNMNNCGTFMLNNNNASSCYSTNWFYSILYNDNTLMWTISENSHSEKQAFIVSDHNKTIDPRVKEEIGEVYPVVYLTPDIILTGTGTSDDPYRITDKVPEKEEEKTEPSQVVNVPSTALYTSMLILTVGLLLIIVAILVIRKVTRKNS